MHDVRDIDLRKRITDVLGEEIHFFSSNSDNNGGGNNSFQNGAKFQPPTLTVSENNVNVQHGNNPQSIPMEGPLTEKQMLERNSAQAVLPWNPSSKLDDWYN